MTDAQLVGLKQVGVGGGKHLCWFVAEDAQRVWRKRLGVELCGLLVEEHGVVCSMLPQPPPGAPWRREGEESLVVGAAW